MSKFGVDLASYQDGISMQAVKEDSNKFAFFKATEGLTYIDRPLKNEHDSARKMGLKIGFYHFARFDLNSGISEADYFYNTIKSLISKGDTIWLDYEAQSLGHASKITDFINRVEHNFNNKVHCGLYCSESPYNSEKLYNYIKSHTPIWVAKYGEIKPNLAVGSADVWQFTSSYMINGYYVDRNEVLTDNWEQHTYKYQETKPKKGYKVLQFTNQYGNLINLKYYDSEKYRLNAIVDDEEISKIKKHNDIYGWDIDLVPYKTTSECTKYKDLECTKPYKKENGDVDKIKKGKLIFVKKGSIKEV